MNSKIFPDYCFIIWNLKVIELQFHVFWHSYILGHAMHECFVVLIINCGYNSCWFVKGVNNEHVFTMFAWVNNENMIM